MAGGHVIRRSFFAHSHYMYMHHWIKMYSFTRPQILLRKERQKIPLKLEGLQEMSWSGIVLKICTVHIMYQDFPRFCQKKKKGDPLPESMSRFFCAWLRSSSRQFRGSFRKCGETIEKAAHHAHQSWLSVTILHHYKDPTTFSKQPSFI